MKEGGQGERERPHSQNFEGVLMCNRGSKSVQSNDDSFMLLVSLGHITFLSHQIAGQFTL